MTHLIYGDVVQVSPLMDGPPSFRPPPPTECPPPPPPTLPDRNPSPDSGLVSEVALTSARTGRTSSVRPVYSQIQRPVSLVCQPLARFKRIVCASMFYTSRVLRCLLPSGLNHRFDFSSALPPRHRTNRWLVLEQPADQREVWIEALWSLTTNDPEVLTLSWLWLSWGHELFDAGV